VAKPRLCKSNYLVAFVLVLSACSSQPIYDSGPTISAKSVPDLADDAIPRDEPRSRHGNGPYYRVNGATYEVLDTDYGYNERGVASWYGKKFHGQLTSNQERYDMYAMTAAHKSLPLPSYARVRNLKNGKSVVVRVNDRGPFIDNRLIDLSYAAAVKLDMITTGTSLVEVTAISFDEPPETQPAEPDIVDQPSTEAAEYIFVQVGAFGEPENARRRFSLLRDVGIDRAFVYEDRNTSPALYRVRIGPIADVLQYDSIVEQLQRIGISETHLVTE
jgi:rare lipoprotein A